MFFMRIDGEDTYLDVITIEDAKALMKDEIALYYQAETSTIWVKAHLFWNDEDGEEEFVETIKVEIHPSEPKCVSKQDAHDFQSPSFLGGLSENPGVWGSGGGVIKTECCMKCGCAKRTNTWAQDNSDGEQGLTSITYEPKLFLSDITEMEE